MKKKTKPKPNYQNLYPNIKLGLGAQFPGKPRFRSIFHPFFWRDIRFEIKAAWQRAIRGYDDSAVWGLDEYLKKFLTRALLDLADNHHGVPQLEEWADIPLEEKDKLWTQKLVDLAAHFYESCDWEESEVEKNEFSDEWHESRDIAFEPSPDKKGHYEMVTKPKNGYTQEQIDELEEKYFNREREIEKYKRGQLEKGMAELTAVFDHLWD